MNFVVTVIKSYSFCSTRKLDNNNEQKNNNFFFYLHTQHFIRSILDLVVDFPNNQHTWKHLPKTVSAWIKSRHRSRGCQSFFLLFLFSFRLFLSFVWYFLHVVSSSGSELQWPFLFRISFIYQSVSIFFFCEICSSFTRILFPPFYLSLFSAMKNCALLPEIN